MHHIILLYNIFYKIKGGDCECLCAAISAFARACSIAGVPARWRTPDLCPLMCEAREKHPGGKGSDSNTLESKLK